MKIEHVNAKTVPARTYHFNARWRDFGFVRRAVGMSNAQWASEIVRAARECADDIGLNYDEIQILRAGEPCY